MFIADNQTIKDIQLFTDKRGELSVFNLFDTDIKSYGGRSRLESMLRQPSSDGKLILNRLQLLSYLSKNTSDLIIDGDDLDFIEYFFTIDKNPAKISRFDSIKRVLKPKNNDYIMNRSISLLRDLLIRLRLFFSTLDSGINILDEYKKEFDDILESDPRFYELTGKNHLSSHDISRFDNLFRYKSLTATRRILDILYDMDVYLALSDSIGNGKFSIPNLSSDNGVIIKGLRHPFIDNAVKNDFTLNDEKNICFLTGANMSGKSTFMKAFSIATYLAHCGFPVPADEMTFSIYEGMFTAISTHIVEVAERLQAYNNINFLSFKTELIEDQLRCTYKLSEGITEDKYGMYILNKEKIIDLITGNNKS